VNARLQVEHPVTEMVFRDAPPAFGGSATGLDLVELQLQVADGQKLPDLSTLKQNGHAIEARVYAEDPAKGFIPKPGPIAELAWGEGENVRIESGVRAGNVVTPYYDPMIAKMVAWGPDRAAAIATLDDAIARTTLGPCTTNLAFLRKMLASEEFRSGRYDTATAEVIAKR